MKKSTAITLLGGTPGRAAESLGFKTVQAVYLMPEKFTQAQADRVNGAYMRLNKRLPPAIRAAAARQSSIGTR